MSFYSPTRLLTVAAGLSAAAAPAAHAVEASEVLAPSFGPFSIRPHLAVAESFDSNIFYRDEKTEEDFITITSPGINFVLGREELNYISLDYRLDYLFYAKNEQLNTDQHTFSHELLFQKNKISLEGRDNIRLLSNVLGGGSGIGRQVDRIIYSDVYTVNYDFSEKTAVYIEGDHYTTDYEEGIRLLDVTTIRGTGGFSYQAFPKTRVFGEVYYGQAAVDSNVPFNPNDPVSQGGPRSEFIGGFVGARGDFTTKLTGTAKAGYETKSFSDDTPSVGAPVFEVGLNYTFSAKTSTSLNYSRRTRLSDQAPGTSVTADTVSLQLNQVIGTTGKLVGSLRVSYAFEDYERRIGTFSDRQDNQFNVAANLTYHFQLWLRGILSYEFEKFETNLPSTSIVDYDVNRVTLAISVGY